MEKKINIAELLKDCPRGTKLYSPLCGECEFRRVYHRNGKICIEIKTNKEIIFCNKYGYYFYGINGEVIIFPSKENRDWSKFKRSFKDGDIIVTTLGNIAILRKPINEESFYIYGLMINNSFYKDETTKVFIKRFATKEEKEKLFQAIKDNGYKWNSETKTLEKLNKDKFDIANLKPFEKVLVRQNVNGKWGIDFFGFYTEGYYYTTGSCIYVQCIPYEENKHLIGTTNNCDEYYKTWE